MTFFTHAPFITDFIEKITHNPAITLFFEGGFFKTVDFYDRLKIEVDYNIFREPELRALVKNRGVQGYSGLRKADLISILRFHSECTRASTEEGNNLIQKNQR